MTPRSPAPPLDPIPLSKGADLSAPEKQLFGVSTGLSVDSATPGDMRCVIPGCLDPQPWVDGIVPAAPLQAFRIKLRDKGLRLAVAHTTWRLAWVAWNFLRHASGDDAYERYLDHMMRAHPGESGLSRGEYYRFRTEQKWNRITRCC